MIFTNQTKLWKIDMIKNVLGELNLDILVVIGFGKTEFKKPNVELFNIVIKDFNKNTSFYCGDSAGRSGDWSDSDKIFAENIGINFKIPEDIFPIEVNFVKETKKYYKNIQEMIILVGYQSSGKTTFSEKYLVPYNYVRIDGDFLKTIPKMLKVAENHIKDNKSVIIDRTNPKKEDREKFITLAKKYNIPIRCFVFNVNIEKAMELNTLRMNTTGKKVPKIAFYVFRKNYEQPTYDEGCEIIEIKQVLSGTQ